MLAGAVSFSRRSLLLDCASGLTALFDTFLELLRTREHPDYENLALPVAPPVAQTTLFEKCSAPREIRANGSSYYRAITIYELGDEIARRAADAYMALAGMVDSYV